MTDLAIVIPIKDPRGAKQRLAGLFTQATRTELAVRLLHQTLADLAAFAPDADRLVVSDDPNMASIAARHGAAFLHEAVGEGETAAVDRATAWTKAGGYAAQIVIPADMARLAESDVRALIDARRIAPSIMLCPAVGEDGTNAILATPPDAIGYRFGERSFAGFQARAAAAGIPCRIMRLASFVLDIDTLDDVRAFMAGSPDNPIAQWLTTQTLRAAS